MLQNYFQNRIIQHEIIENAKRYRSKQMHLHRFTSLTNKSKNALPNYYPGELDRLRSIYMKAKMTMANVHQLIKEKQTQKPKTDKREDIKPTSGYQRII